MPKKRISKSGLANKCARHSLMKSRSLLELGDLARGIDAPGAIVECGVYSGGSAAAIWHSIPGERDLWLFDSWQGLPEPINADGSKAKKKYIEKTLEPDIGWCKGDIVSVFEILRYVGVDWSHLNVWPGWFDDTIRIYSQSIGEIAILHIDADWYESTKIVLVHLFPKIVEGGLLIVDDYNHWVGCKKAVDEYLESKRMSNIKLEKSMEFPRVWLKR